MTILEHHMTILEFAQANPILAVVLTFLLTEALVRVVMAASRR